jgi:hypothetical protein
MGEGNISRLDGILATFAKVLLVSSRVYAFVTRSFPCSIRGKSRAGFNQVVGLELR